MNSFLHQASFATGYWCYDRHRSVRLVVLVGLAIDQIAQSGLSSLSVIYYSAHLFSTQNTRYASEYRYFDAIHYKGYQLQQFAPVSSASGIPEIFRHG
ncbi:hypothetical protein AGG97_07645 [Klebsiella michiganensis]|nr:hypothetical protein AGG97_07645 [Klebsiella michiganensis]